MAAITVKSGLRSSENTLNTARLTTLGAGMVTRWTKAKTGYQTTSAEVVKPDQVRILASVSGTS